MGIRFCLIILLSVIFELSYSQSLNKSGHSKPEKAGDALNAYNYFLAKKLYNQSLSNYPAIGSYGLSVIYSRNDNPFYQLDSAYNRILSSQDFYPVKGKKEAKILKRLNIDSLTIINQKSKIENLAFENASRFMDIDSLNHFITFYNLSTLIPAAIEKRDSIAYKEAQSQKTASAMKGFLTQYPQSKLFNEARTKYDKLFYNEETRDGSIESYSRFVVNHPQSPYQEQAELKLYKLETNGKSDLATYYNFIKKYPSNVFVDEAWQKVYSIYRSEKPGSGIPEFLIDYPEYSFKARLLEEYKLEGIDFLPYKQGELWGFINSDGEIVVEAKYDFVEEFSEGIAIVSTNGKLGYITKTGENLVPPIYDEAENFHNSLAIVGEAGKFGVIDRNGKMLIPMSYSEIADFSEGLAAAFDGNYFGYIDRSGTVIIPFRFNEAGEFKNGTAVCMINEMYGIIDSAGNEVIPFYYEGIENFSNAFSRVRNDNQIGLINREGAVILSPEFDEIGVFSDNRALVIKGKKMGYINNQGAMVIPMNFIAGPETILKSTFDAGLAIIRSNAGYGIIDTSGKRMVPPQFEDIGTISEGVFPIKRSGKWGCYNIALNKIIIKPVYEKMSSFYNGYAIVYKKGKAGVINRTGTLEIACEYESLKYLGDGILVAILNGKSGIIDIDNNILVAFDYDQSTVQMNKYIKMTTPTSILWFDIKSRKIFWKGLP